MNDEYHEETKVVVQVIMPNDHSKQNQHNQRKQLKRYDHTDTNKEDHIETRDDDKTKVVISMDDHLKQGVQSNWYDSLEQEQHYCFGSIIRIDYDGQGQSDRDPSLLDDNDDCGNDSNDTHRFAIFFELNDNSEPASRNDSRIRRIPTAAVAPELNACVDQLRARDMQQINDLVYYDSNSDDEDNRDTFHASIQIEDMIDDTYNDNDDVNRKPINNVIDYGEKRLTLYIINYVVCKVIVEFEEIPC